MQVDTGAFRALTETVSALGAEVAGLHGRQAAYEEKLNWELGRAIKAAGLIRSAVIEETERHARQGRHAAPRRNRHGLRLVGGREVAR